MNLSQFSGTLQKAVSGFGTLDGLYCWSLNRPLAQHPLTSHRNFVVELHSGRSAAPRAAARKLRRSWMSTQPALVERAAKCTGEA
jgi:hypothetical protein